MPSPFPGMNPYFEQEDQWHSFHEWITRRMAELLVEKTPERYLVKIDENVYLHELSSEQRRLLGRPDVQLVEVKTHPLASSASGPALTEAPVYAQLPATDLERLSTIEIRDGRNRRLITAIEFLSPTNKRPGPDRDLYLAKRARMLHNHVNLVEIDLLRGWPRMPMTGTPECDYLAMVARTGDWPRAGIWPIGLRDPLPAIPIPLDPPDPDVKIDLQDLLNRTYDAGGYARFLYDGDPEPPLRPEDAAWASEMLTASRSN